MKPSVNHTLRRAKSHEQKGEIDEARTLYQTVLQAFPSNNRAKLALSKMGQLKQKDTVRNPSQATIKQLVSLCNVEDSLHERGINVSHVSCQR